MLAKALKNIGSLATASNKRRLGAIGLHCALEEVHMVQMSIDDAGQTRLEAAASEPFCFDAESIDANANTLPEAVRNARRNAPFKGKQVVSSMPYQHLRIFPVSFKVNAGQNEGNAIVNAAKARIEGPIADYVLDFLPIRTDPQQEDRLGIVALSKRDSVLSYLEVLRKCGLQPLRLEIGPVAIRRLVGSIRPDHQFENVIAINFGRDASYLSVISGRRLLLDQTLALGEDRLLEVISSALNLTHDQVRATIARHGLFPTDSHAETAATMREIVKPAFLEVVEEINRTLIYIASQTRGEPVRRVYLLGSLARWRGADRLLNSLIKLEVETIPNPLSFYSDTENAEQPSPDIAVATGLALSGMFDDE